MKSFRWLIPLLLLCLASAESLLAQGQPQVANGFRNRFSLQGAPVVPPGDPLTPGLADLTRAAYDLQFKSGTAFGGWATTRIAGPFGSVFAGSPTTALGPTTLTLPSGGGVKLASVRMSRPVVLFQVSYSLGAEIPVPLVQSNGQPAPADFYLPQPANTYQDPPTNSVVNPLFYFSPHAGKVYATQPGVVVIEWKERVSGNIFSQVYGISTSPAKPERKIFWTEKGFTGPKIVVPPSRVGAINIVYNSLVPRTVPAEFVSPYVTPPDPGAQFPPELRTLWYDTLDGLIHAYNREGRVFLEYLGNLDPDGVTREQLGYEIVNVVKEERPITIHADIGGVVAPPDGDPALSATVAAGMNGADTPYLHEHISLGGTKRTLYAIRRTAPGVFVNGVEQQVSNEVLIFWLERAELDIAWPKFYTGYLQDWPASLDQYSLYARPDAGTAEGAQASLDTAVALASANNPALVYQDDPTSQQAKLAPGNLFRTDLTLSDPANRALLRFSRDEDIWFERVFSRLDSTFDTRQFTAAFDPETGLFMTGFTGIGNVSLVDPNDPARAYVEGVDYSVNYLTGEIQKITGGAISETAAVTLQVFQDTPVASPLVLMRDVGQRLDPPVGGNDSLVGYLRQPAGTAFDVTAYKDPFVNGFTEAAKGAIIGVNALPDNDRLEVWWYRKSRPPGTKITGTLWPAFVQRYGLRWPATTPKIVLASNKGSDALPSLQASGSIYYQNDSTLPGYNPNEEHALMINGRAWALRDDLNIASSSEPYVLVRYTEADARPAMAVFQVLREDATYTFNYNATAGLVLQAPMPLPILSLPIKADRSVANYEVPDAPADPAPGFDPDRDPAFEHYQKFTFEDRKGTHWVYRGPHGGNSAAPAPNFRMRYFYQTMPGFHFPDLASQPAAGTIVPYLRPGVPGAYAGDPATGQPLDIVFTPKWPVSVPELRISETLTVARLGLPAVRGQTSAELLYQQSIAGDATPALAFADRLKSASLYDPTRAKTHPLDPDGLAAIPGSVKTSSYLGKKYFPNLPPHLSQRLYFDPNAGAEGSLIFVGEFKDETVGEKYLQLNVMSAEDVTAARALCAQDDTEKAAWDTAIGQLKTTVETFIEDPAQAGSYIVDHNRDATVGPTQIAEVNDDDIAVDSYAVAGIGGGSGYVVMITGNGRAFTPPGEPVSLHIFRVTPPVVRGELKVIAPANPLDEKLTLQHSADFAGHPGDYEFEWRYSPPIDGAPPLLYTFQRALLLGDSTGAADTEWTLISNPGADFENYRAPDADLSAGVAVNLPTQQVVVNDGLGTAANGTTRPHAILRRTFTVPQQPYRLFVSLALGIHEGVAVYANQAKVATWNLAGQTSSVPTGSPGAAISPLPLIFEIDPNALTDGTNVLTLELTSAADAGFPASINARLEASNETENLAAWIPLPPGPDDVAGEVSGSVVGKVRHTIQGNSILTLTDNYFTMRFRPRESDNAAHVPMAGWSKWVTPQLAEGWIKRALAGINPFQQRITDLFNNPVDTDVSMVMQAGRRWEGDIALNLENINDFGLIEIYETILRRGRGLSIEGNPPINYDAANDALLLAAGYLSDLYTILGNEAFADAANPTIAFGLDDGRTFGDVATALFAFKGQVPTLLEEELGLLRGRDDFLQPGTRVAPVYNRMVWNYTRGILSGEAIYALNYNIRDMNGDGDVEEADAAALYPQGNGDAYGHYLTALTGYYSLLSNPNFSWTPRTEAVLVAGVPVQVDYLDERKFAGAAAALARTASQTLDLTYRQAWTAAETPGWSNLRDGRTNATTGQVRAWGTDDWACRAGQGAYLHWVTANSLLPAVDPDPNHEGIQKIDRTTVPELAEIVTRATAVQQTLDNADARLNPLGLSRGALAFDISPTEIDAGKTHFEQIYERAISALQNASAAFINAKDSTQFLRRQEETLAGQRNAIAEQERAFTNQLIEIYGTPYPDDVGPGKTYQQGYTGPDLFHPMYVEITEDLAGGNFTPVGRTQYTLYTGMSPASVAMANGELAPTGTLINPNAPLIDPDDLSDPDDPDYTPPTVVEVPAGISGPVEFTLDAISGTFRKPEGWTGRRASPGRIQTAVSNELLARQDFFGALYDFNRLAEVMSQQLALYQSAIAAHNSTRMLMLTNHQQQTALESANTALATISRLLEHTIEVAEIVKDAVDEGTPGVVGTANDPSFAARLAANGSYGSVVSGLRGAQAIADTQKDINDQLKEAYGRLLELTLAEVSWGNENKQLILGLQQSLQNYIDSSGAIDATYRRYDQANRDLAAVTAEGLRVQQSREVFRQRASAIIQGYRTKDLAFRAFRNEALEKYKTLFDLAARYAFLAARAYDYETGLLNPDGSTAASSFYQKIAQARALGVISGGQPQFGASTTGDPGLSGVLAQMAGDWSVVKSRLGFNNPDRYRTTFSLRNELHRIINGDNGVLEWKDRLQAARMANILDDPDVKRYCLQAADPNGQPVPGIVISFESLIETGVNFFGHPLAGGDHTFTPSSFATKIRSSGIAFAGYVGMDSPTTTSGALGDIGAVSPDEPGTGFASLDALSATPYVYLIPAGTDTLRAPPLGDVYTRRTWVVEDQAIPLPFNIANSGFSTNRGFISSDSLTEPAFTLRKHQAFRAVPDGTNFSSDPGFTNSRLIGRSVWNTRWKLVIPGNTLLSDPDTGLQTFIDTVTDIKLHLETYSYSGN